MNNRANSSYPLGGIVMIEKVDKEFDLFSKLFSGIEGGAKDFIPLTKLFVHNKLTHSVSVRQILKTYPEELSEQLGMKDGPSERTLYRTLERIGKNFPIVFEMYQDFIKENGLADSEQIIDFSSTYVEGNRAELAEFGYSRDRRPDRKQIT